MKESEISIEEYVTLSTTDLTDCLKTGYAPKVELKNIRIRKPHDNDHVLIELNNSNGDKQVVVLSYDKSGDLNLNIHRAFFDDLAYDQEELLAVNLETGRID